MIDIRSKYHIALNDVGLVLQNAPQEPAYLLEQAAAFNNRYAQGDRTYDDFAKWWYWAQTDWYQGFKDDTEWGDDGKYYYSTNIDAWSQIGAIQLAPAQTLDNTFSEDIICGGVFEVNGTTYKFIGTNDGTDSRPHIYRSAQGTSQSWTDVSGTTIGTNQNVIAQMSGRSGILWVSTVGVGATWVVITYDGSTWTDQSNNIYVGAALTYQPGSSRCHVTVGDTMYVFVDNAINDSYALVKTTQQNPSASGHWSKVFEKTKEDGLPMAAAEYNGNIYYLVNRTYNTDLRLYNISANTDTLVRTFKNTTIQNWGMGDKLLVVYNSKLVITLPNKEIWEMNGTTLTRIFRRDDYKNNINTYQTVPYLYYGGIVANNKMWWGNAMYNGSVFYNTWRPSDDSDNFVYPMFVDPEDRLWMTESVNQKKLYYLNLSPSVFKGADNKNYLVMNQFATVSGIDKILYSVTLIFKKFSSGQSIEIEYTTGELTSSTTWTSLGTASYTLDGASATEKTLYFPVNTTCKKVWYRIKLEGDTTNTPVLYDVVTAYLPRPFADKQWRINVDCGDEIRLLNDNLETRNGREIKGKLEQAWLTNQIVDFQDVDYASTALNGLLSNSATTITVDDTSEFSECGRLRIEDEIIYYTGKTPTTLTGCSRGQKGTKAVSHADDTTVHNGYKVIIQSFNARVPIINNGKRLEYIAGLSLREVI